jgi:eukaryotic-like serine/threonine-protein kinase
MLVGVVQPIGVYETGSGSPPAPRDGLMMSSLGNLTAGQTLGRYELLLPVAQGGMAVVWAARMRGGRGFSKIVAVKTMLPTLSEDPRFEKMFLTEAELAARIKHPHVCEILDLGEQDKVLYLVMEWLDGESLATLLNECRRQGRTIPFSVAARIVLDAARGLHAAHELKNEDGELAGVVHRDVSPQNILVTYDGIVKIVDFGVAKAVARSEHQVTHAGHVKGKVQYMAPEQAFCDEVDRRTDVFALGIVLYQITTGTHPFRADNELATLARITSPEPVPSPGTLVPGYPPELASVVMQALEKNPKHRFGTMLELARALETVTARMAALGDEQTVEAFVAETLGQRAAERAAAIKDALRLADDRVEKTLTGVTALPRLTSDAVTEEPASGEAAVAVPRRTWSGARVGTTVGLIVLGAGLGAAVIVWAGGPVRAPASAVASSPGPALATAMPTAAATEAPTPPPAATVAPRPSASPPAADASSVAAAASASASASPAESVDKAITAALAGKSGARSLRPAATGPAPVVTAPPAAPLPKPGGKAPAAAPQGESPSSALRKPDF